MPKGNAIGIDLGGSNLRVALISSDGSVVKKIKEPTSENIKDSLKRAVDSLVGEDVAGIGVGVAGIIDRSAKMVITSPNIPFIDGFDFRYLSDSLPLYIENDASVAALGEMWVGLGREFSSFILLTLGTGIGGGIIYEGRLMDVSAEIGHMSIEWGGEKCPCGNYGCLELYASARAITGAVIKGIEGGTDSILKARSNIYKLTVEDVYNSAFEGDNLSREVLKEAGKYLGVSIANLINLLSPPLIVLAGGLIGAWDLYIKEAIKEAGKRTFKSLFDAVKILPASTGEEAGILGAARLVFQEEGNL